MNMSGFLSSVEFTTLLTLELTLFAIVGITYYQKSRLEVKVFGVFQLIIDGKDSDQIAIDNRKSDQAISDSQGTDN